LGGGWGVSESSGIVEISEGKSVAEIKIRRTQTRGGDTGRKVFCYSKRRLEKKGQT